MRRSSQRTPVWFPVSPGSSRVARLCEGLCASDLEEKSPSDFHREGRFLSSGAV